MAEASIVHVVPDQTVVAEPIPSDDEAVAIIAAMEALWPRPVMMPDASSDRNTAWRFSGRWWARPVAVRRDRPYR